MAHTGGFNASKNDAEDPVVIVGMGCRYPGEAKSPEGFWEMISNGRTAHSEIPKERFNIDGYYHPSQEREGGISCRGGYFLDSDPGAFDAPFFSITAYEAASMDVMQRLILEVVYEALENAGISLQKIAGTKTAAYVGCFTKDYEELSSRDVNNTNGYLATGGGRSMLSNRISWFYDLRGPSMTIDTACSSSLYGLHLACQSLRLGESTTAIVGGTNVILSPDIMHVLSYMHFLSPDGKCHSFDHRANGYARGEGFGVVVLKRLSQAIADGDTIRAVIRASGINQDGHTPGITVPSSEQQAELIQTCYKQAGITFDETRYFEAHGTGTAVGDPLELSGIGETFGPTRDSSDPLWVSSVKANIGHQEGGAGLAGIIRALMSIEKGFIAPLADFEAPNPALKLEEWKVELPLKLMPWPKPGIRRASVNSFGYGGANAHTILDDAYHYLQQRGIEANHATHVRLDDSIDTESDSGFSSGAGSMEGLDTTLGANKFRLFPISALDQPAVKRTLEGYAKFLQKRSDNDKLLENGEKPDTAAFVENLAYTLAHRRTIFNHRSFIVSDSVEDMITQLQDSAPQSRKVTKTENIAFVFTGQGAQWSQMGKELLRFPTFHRSLARAQATLTSLQCPWDIVEELSKDASESRINSPDFSQPLCTALQLALVDLLEHWGIKPTAVVGHSSGEIAAAYASGALTHEDAAKIAYYRGVFSAEVNQRLESTQGAMLAVGLSDESVKPYLQAARPGTVVIACINSPESVTLSGDRDQIDQIDEKLKSEQIFSRKLKVTTAYHSHHMEVIAQDYDKAMGLIRPSTEATGIRMFSSVTASQIDPQQLDASYWVTNMLKPVRFSEAVKALFTSSEKSRGRKRAAVAQYRAIIEIGPHEALKGPVKQIIAALENKALADVVYTSMVLRGSDADRTSLETAGRLWSVGAKIDFDLLNVEAESRHKPMTLSELPSYPWNHSKRMWHEGHWSTTHRSMKEPRTDLLGVLYDDYNDQEPRWRNVLSARENPWLIDHRIQNAVLFPGAGMLIMALEAASKLAEHGKKVKGYSFRDITFSRAIVIPTDARRLEVAIHVKQHKIGTRAATAPWYSYTVYSLGEQGTWTDHSTGLFSIVYDDAANEVDDGSAESKEWKAQTKKYQDIKERAHTKLPKKIFYKVMEAIGLQYGPTFQGLEECHIAKQESHGTIVIPDTKSVMPHQFEFPHLIHPATLDSIFHLLPATVVEGNDSAETMVPISVGKMFISADLPSGAGAKFKGYATSYSPGETKRFNVGHVVISDDEWSAPKIIIDEFTTTALSSIAVGGGPSAERPRKCTSVQWTEDIRYSTSLLRPLPAIEEGSSAAVVAVDEELIAAVTRSMGRALGYIRSVEQDKLSKHLNQFNEWADGKVEAIQTPVPVAEESTNEQSVPVTKEPTDEQPASAEIASTEPVTNVEVVEAVPPTSTEALIEQSSPEAQPEAQEVAEEIPLTNTEALVEQFSPETQPEAQETAASEPQKPAEPETVLEQVTAEVPIEETSKDNEASKVKDQPPSHLTALEDFPEHLLEKITNGTNPADALSSEILNAVYRVTEPSSDEISRCVVQLLEKAHHADPALKALLIGNGSHSSAIGIAKSFAGKAGRYKAFKQCIIAEADDQALARTKQSLKEHKLRTDYRTIDLNDKLSKQGFESQSFGVVVAPLELQNGANVDDSLVALRDLIRPGGYLILASTKSVPVATTFFHGLSESWWTSNSLQSRDYSEETWLASIEKAGFKKLGASVVSPDNDSVVVAAVNPAIEDYTVDDNEITILRAAATLPEVDELAENLIARLESTGLNAVFATLEDFEKLSKKTVISLIELEKDFVSNMTAEEFDKFKVAGTTALRTLWLTRGGQPVGEVSLTQSMSAGLLRTLRSESGQTSLTHLDLSLSADVKSEAIADIIFDVLSKSVLPEKVGKDYEFIERDGKIYIPRLEMDHSFDSELDLPNAKVATREEPLVQPGRPLKMVIGTAGMLDSLRWVDDIDFIERDKSPWDIEIQVTHAPLNFVDVMAAMGQIPTDVVGREAAGIVTSVGPWTTRFKIGDHVVVPPASSFATHLREEEKFFQKVPAHMDPAEAASCATIYMTAYCGLIDIARLQKGETILIHAAAGGLGQAAIQLAQWIGAEIYVTVGTNAKKQLIMEQYGISEDRIFSSRDLSFAPAIMQATDNKGVNVVLNSLAGEALRQTWLCVADFGRFIEVGKKDMVGNTGLDMAPFLRHITFASVNMEMIGNSFKDLYARLMSDVFKLLEQRVVGTVHPITKYNFTETEKAFRTMQTGKHTGKIVLCVDKDDVVPVLPPKPKPTQLDPKGTYVLVGGLGGIGRSIAKFMFERNAGRIVFLSRSGTTKNPEAKEFLAQVASRNKLAESIICDTTDAAQVEAFAERCRSEGWTVKGLVQCAMVLQDSALDNMTFENWKAATEPKVKGTMNLHDSLPKDMDFFIMLSSMSGVLGNPGQANYAAGNTFLDALAHFRRSRGWAATTIDLGIVQGVGFVAENSEKYEKFDHITSSHLSERDVRYLLLAAMAGRTADGVRAPAQIVTGVTREFLTDAMMPRSWQQDAKYSHILSAAGAEDEGMADSAENEELRDNISGAPTLREASVVIREALVQKMAKALLMEPEDIDVEKPLSSYGVDSLVAVEMRNWIFRELKSDIAVFEIISQTPISTLSLKIAHKSKLVSHEPSAEELELLAAEPGKGEKKEE